MKRLLFEITAAAVHGADQGVKDPNLECTSLSVFTQSVSKFLGLKMLFFKPVFYYFIERFLRYERNQLRFYILHMKTHSINLYLHAEPKIEQLLQGILSLRHLNSPQTFFIFKKKQQPKMKYVKQTKCEMHCCGIWIDLSRLFSFKDSCDCQRPKITLKEAADYRYYQSCVKVHYGQDYQSVNVDLSATLFCGM